MAPSERYRRLGKLVGTTSSVTSLCHDRAMNQADLLKLSNREIESRAVEAVIAFAVRDLRSLR